ncbi:MTH1187 family thiamine-binding protein [Ornithinimicrobium flavum]|uniref:MTH1187 family thiamine-binding protein n=1 Tax=Ornithinimicrobium flavum TaxID=1288636 RepID=UPI00106F3C0A|nr:MTH1187 family thiamine-binding protein [Ornithinimicrobium flavum]
MLFAFSVAPSVSDKSGSVSAAVADAIRVVRDSGLPYELTSMFTTIEGDWDEVMPVIKAACDAVAQHGPRVSLVLKADLRPGYADQLTAKVSRVREHLDQEGLA